MADKENLSCSDAPLTRSVQAPRQQTEDTNIPTDISVDEISAPQRQKVPPLLSQLAQNSARASSQDLYDHASVGYCTVSEDGLILQADEATAKLFGVTREELCCKLLSCFIIAEDREHDFTRGKQIIATGEPCSYEIRMVKHDGTAFWAHLIACLAQDADGVPVRRIALNDITKNKMAALALHESTQFTQSVLDSIPFQIAVLDHGGIIIKVNEAWRLSALENSNLPGQVARHTQIGSSYLETGQTCFGKCSEGATEAREGILAVLEGRKSRFNLDYPCHSPNQQRWFTLFVSPMLGHGVVITHVDVTARKVAEENIAQHRDALVREVHHRIKNNLQGVAGLLQRELGLFQRFDTRLATAIGQVNAIAISHGLQAIYPDESVRLCDSISHICTMLSTLAQCPILFQIEHEQSFVPIQIDPNETVSVALVLNELILNAVKHSPDECSPPVVSLASDGTSARVVIRNEVTGAPDFNIQTGKGLGTGLSLVRSLLPKQGAHLVYELDQQCNLLATLHLTAPVVMPATNKNGN